MNVLSLFNGMGGAGLALKELNIKCQIYASEIDKYANQVSNAILPNTINLGCITKINASDLPKIDILIGGSPCQGFSFVGKMLNFDDERSKLFFEFVRILKECQAVNPNVKFLLENVPMEKQCKNHISRLLGIDPVCINSNLVSAQNRKRLYWTNIGTVKNNMFGFEQIGIQQPKDRFIFLKDVLENDVNKKYYLSEKATNYVQDIIRIRKKFTALDGDKALCLTAKGIQNNTGTFITQKGRDNKGGNHYEKSPAITDPDWQNNNNVSNVRRLTPLEVARLQTIPIWAIEIMLNCGGSDPQLYKMLGNGFTVEVIIWILSHLKQ